MQRQLGSLTPAQMQAYQQQATSMNTDDIQRARTQMDSMCPDQFKQVKLEAHLQLPKISARRHTGAEGYWQTAA